MAEITPANAEFHALKGNVSKLIREGEERGQSIDTKSSFLVPIRNVIKQNGPLVGELCEHFFYSLETNNCVRRQVCLSLFDYFFERSHIFRLNVVENIQNILRCCCETEPLRYPLPGPKDEANALKIFAIKMMKRWHEKFGAGYLKLQQLDGFLAKSKSFDYNQASAESVAERNRLKAAEDKKKLKAEKKSKQIKAAFEAAQEDIDRCLMEADSALKILIPVFEEAGTSEGNAEKGEMNRQLHGYADGENISVTIDSICPTVQESDENDAVVQSVRDSRVLIEVYHKMISKWLNTLTECGATQEIVKQLIDVKFKMESVCQKIDELKIMPQKMSRKKGQNDVNSDSDDDSDLEDVPEKEIQHFVPSIESDVPAYIMKRIAEDDASQKPCCSKDLPEQKDSTSKSPPKAEVEDEKKIPKLMIGLDLIYWEEKNRGPVEIPSNNADGHRFWRPPDEDQTRKVGADVYGERLITYIGEEKRPERRCNARLSNGTLCPRMEFNRCPIHGTLVERDSEGFPVDQQAGQCASGSGYTTGMADEDSDFMRDLEAGTGKSFSFQSKKKRTLKKPIPEGKAVRERLEKKLLDKRTIKRVSDALDAVRKAKIHKNFGHQFSHAFHK